MSGSRRANLFRRGLALFGSGDDATLDERRAAMDRIDLLPRPRKVDYADAAIAGVPAIVATPTRGVPERHILYVHGGGYVVGSPRSHIAMAARLAKRANAVTSVIDYRLAPEHPYPAAVDDCVAAYRAIVERTDPALLTIAGDSAGGGAALATLVALRDAGDPLPGCAYLLSPWIDLTGPSDSAAQYAGDTPRDHPGVSPLFAELRGLPPMLVQAGSKEVLLSDSITLAERATAAGAEVLLDVREGMWHVFQIFAGYLPEATRALIDAATFIRTHTPAARVTAGV